MFRSTAFAFAILLFLAVSCAGRHQEPLVPEKTQRGAEQRYGEQQGMMNSLSQTPAEQAAALHEQRAKPAPDSGEAAEE